jgi:hypothetical protein
MRAIRSTAFAQKIARGYAERNMTSVVSIGRPDEVDDHDDATEPTTTKMRKLIYWGKARVYTASGSGSLDTGDDLVYLSRSYISIPLFKETPPFTQVDDLIEIIDHDDIDIIGRVFRIVGIDYAGQFPVVRRHTVMSVDRSVDWTWIDDA